MMHMGKIFRLNDLTNYCERKEICVGINWGKAKATGFWGLFKFKKGIDLDASVAVYDEQMELIDIAYYNHLHTKDNAIQHSGDNLTGKGDFEQYNEVLSIKFPHLDPKAKHLFLILTSYENHDLSNLSCVKLDIYEGTPYKIEKNLVSYQPEMAESFTRKSGSVLGEFYKEGQDWFFRTLSQPLGCHKISQIVKTIPEKYPVKLEENIG